MHARVLSPGDEALLIATSRVVDEDEVPSPARAQALLNDPCFVAVVALDGETPVGLTYGHVLPQLTRTGLLIYSVDTIEGRRRQGAARAMIAALRALCLARGWYEMWVPTNTSNAAAMGLYEACGGMREDDDEAIFVWPTDS